MLRVKTCKDTRVVELPLPHLQETGSEIRGVRDQNTPYPQLRFRAPPTRVLLQGLPLAQGVDARAGRSEAWRVRAKLSLTGEERQGEVGVVKTTQSRTPARVSQQRWFLMKNREEQVQVQIQLPDLR